MDQKSESSSGRSADETVFIDKCKSLNEVFNGLCLHRAEIILPYVGLMLSKDYAMAHVKKRTEPIDILVRPMKFVMIHDSERGLVRYVEQPLTKPMQFGTAAIKTNGFSYSLSPRTDASVSRLVVNMEDLENAIDLVIAEANRFYLLYCYPYT